jgi:predicted nuclease with TOPRIM domain
MSIPEAMEYLNELKLHQQELEEETKRLRHQHERLEEELSLLEDAVKRRMEKQGEAYSMMCAVKSTNYDKLFVENRQLKAEITGMKLDKSNGH